MLGQLSSPGLLPPLPLPLEPQRQGLGAALGQGCLFDPVWTLVLPHLLFPGNSFPSSPARGSMRIAGLSGSGTLGSGESGQGPLGG